MSPGRKTIRRPPEGTSSTLRGRWSGQESEGHCATVSFAAKPPTAEPLAEGSRSWFLHLARRYSEPPAANLLTGQAARERPRQGCSLRLVRSFVIACGCQGTSPLPDRDDRRSCWPSGQASRSRRSNRLCGPTRPKKQSEARRFPVDAPRCTIARQRRDRSCRGEARDPLRLRRGQEHQCRQRPWL